MCKCLAALGVDEAGKLTEVLVRVGPGPPRCGVRVKRGQSHQWLQPHRLLWRFGLSALSCVLLGREGLKFWGKPNSSNISLHIPSRERAAQVAPHCCFQNCFAYEILVWS